MNSVQNDHKMGEGRTSRDELRRRALDAARKTLQEEGLKALSARRLAAEIGVAVGTLYNLFENFDEVVLRLNIETLRRLETAIGQPMPVDATPEAQLLVITRRYLDFTTSSRNEWAAVLEFTPAVRRFMDEFNAVIDRLITIVERSLAPLFSAEGDAGGRMAATVLWASLEGIGALAATNNLPLVSEAGAWEMAQSLITNYLRGLRAAERYPGLLERDQLCGGPRS